MVHRPPDSRLLTNLILNEKEYVKHLTGLFPLSHAALASLSAYAAASPAHPLSPAQTIATIVDALAGADDALQRYNLAVDTWRDQLTSLKDLEDDLAAVLRDRDILVTRLIKASKSTRETHRSSRLINPLSGIGSPSLASLPSSNATNSSTGPASINVKLAQAQAELQACEAHLATKEQELDARRMSIARESLGARCRALIDCGWVWGEMGKQGLKALQTLSMNGKESMALNPAITPHLSTKPTVYTSDNSSVTPSQTMHRPNTILEAALEIKSMTEEEGDLTITLPPAHAIAELTLPTGVRSQTPQNGGKALQKSATSAPSTLSDTAHATAPKRQRVKRSRRPPSHHIAEVSDEGSPSNCNGVTVTANGTSATIPPAPFPTTQPHPETQDTSSEDEPPVGPFEVVENDPFEVIRRSMLSPSASSLFQAPPGPVPPNARVSEPDVRTGDETGPSKMNFIASSSRTTKRERRTSIFGSLRGLFRKPKERERISTEWDEDHPSPSPIRTRANGGWITRTDTRIKASSGQRVDDSDEEPMYKVTIPPPVARNGSGTRLRKGKPGPARGTRENAPSPTIPAVLSYRTGVGADDGWLTDGPANVGSAASISIKSGGNRTMDLKSGRPRTRRVTMKRRKTSVADLRGSDQGHTDGEVDDRGQEVKLQPAPSKGKSKALEAFTATVSKRSASPDVEQEVTGRTRTRNGSISKRKPIDLKSVADANSRANAEAGSGSQPRRATTAIVTSNRKLSSNGTLAHCRSASLSVGGTHATTSSEPPRSQTSSQASSQTRSQTPTELQGKQGARRANGDATHAQSVSLMSIVADVTRHDESARTTDTSGSLDVSRASASHARSSSSPTEKQGQGGQRATKMPLRSALRNASRTPSPGPVSVITTVMHLALPGTASPRDSASISSYETGRESFYMDEQGVPSPSPSPPPAPRSQSPVPRSQSPTPHGHARSFSFTFPPPPVEPPPVAPVPVRTETSQIILNADAPTSSNASTETPPVRRKSVRVSLQPTFSPTPPALYDENGQGYAPWTESFSRTDRGDRHEAGVRKTTMRSAQEDVWVDSSEEDEAYSRARWLLSSAGKLDKGKGKA